MMLATSMNASPTTPPKNVARNHCSGSVKDGSPLGRVLLVRFRPSRCHHDDGPDDHHADAYGLDPVADLK